MTNFSNDEKIKKYLDELACEYKELLYKKLIEDNKGLDELRISELLYLDSEIKKPLTRNRNSFIKFLYKSALIGVLYIIIGFVWFLYINVDSKLGVREFMPLLIIFMGVLLLILSLFVYKIRLNKNEFTRTKEVILEKDIKQIRYQIVAMWRDIEGIASDLISDNAAIQGSTPIEKLKSDELINDEEINSLRELLSLRNKIVHGGIASIDISNSFDVIKKCNDILNKLKKIL